MLFEIKIITTTIVFGRHRCKTAPIADRFGSESTLTKPLLKTFEVRYELFV
jgi:hypothetical protein